MRCSLGPGVLNLPGNVSVCSLPSNKKSRQSSNFVANEIGNEDKKFSFPLNNFIFVRTTLSFALIKFSYEVVGFFFALMRVIAVQVKLNLLFKAIAGS